MTSSRNYSGMGDKEKMSEVKCWVAWVDEKMVEKIR